MSEYIDNLAHRVRTIRDAFRELHDHPESDSAKARLRDVLKDADMTDVVAAEQALMAEGVTVKEMMHTCDLHVQVIRDATSGDGAVEVPPGHPVHTFRRENEALLHLIDRIRPALDAPGDDLRRMYNELMDVEKHYQRKEHLLFPFLEKRGVTGPPQVMWAKHDETRELLRLAGDALAERLPAAIESVTQMIDKEERVLWPLSLKTLNETEWGEIWAHSPEFGWCLVEPEPGYTRHAEAATDNTLPDEAIIFPSGSLTPDQLQAVFATLPVDLTFVDADDRVRFFSEGPDRVFARPRTIIGRKVQHCHPPSSVDVVDRILSDFRSNRQDVAEFWIDFRERFVQIRYFALRDAAGGYLGTLEVTQDLTHERALEGERRLLQYD